MWWLNTGVAPIYRDFQLAVQLRSQKSTVAIAIPVDIREWLPGDAVFDGTIYIPDNLPDDSYDFRVGILDPRTGKTAVKFAIEGRQEDGWYTLGAVTVKTK
jgi:Domain of unknown function (DUF4832)